MKEEYFLVSAHRQENIDNPERLADLLSTLNKIAEKFHSPVIVTTHPRLKAMLKQANIETNTLINFVTPLNLTSIA